MDTVKFSLCLVVGVSLLLSSGCNQELQDLRLQNDTQRKRIDQLNSELRTAELELEKLKNQLSTVDERSNIDKDALQKQIAALEEDLAKKKDLIAKLQEQCLGGVTLPVELSTMLEDFANANDMVTFDASRGIVKFKSDLLFEKGSDKVATSAVQAVTSLCTIMNSEQGSKFDIIIAGHTDDIPILKPATRAKHPTNWHLSAHRAISVLDVMVKNKIANGRLSVRGFGEFSPVVPNKAGKKGNPQNRRVEIYIVPEGT